MQMCKDSPPLVGHGLNVTRNAFLVLAVNSHNLRPFELADQRITEILACAKKGHVPVRLVVSASLSFFVAAPAALIMR